MRLSMQFKHHRLEADQIQHKSSKLQGCVFYFHGGGLLFGTRHDLPNVYQELFCRAGYDLIMMDYPLAPEAKLSEIVEAVEAFTRYLIANPKLCGYSQFPDYWLFGRSAGAYLALMTASLLMKEDREKSSLGEEEFEWKKPRYEESGYKESGCKKPSGVVSFYGYHSFLLPEFSLPSPYYQKFPQVSANEISALLAKITSSSCYADKGFLPLQPVQESYSNIEMRYGIYVYARQTGRWLELLGNRDCFAEYCLKKEDFEQLPPCFFTASTADQDVPFGESKWMAKMAANARFFPVYYLPHDFDRDIKQKEGIQIYQKLMEWMKSC